MVKEITNINDFTNAIGTEKTGLIIIDFYAQWCGPCKMFAPAFSSLQEKYPKVGFYKIDIDTKNTKEISTACQIESLPTFCFFKKGKYVTKVIGVDQEQIERLILQNMPKPKSANHEHKREHKKEHKKEHNPTLTKKRLAK